MIAQIMFRGNGDLQVFEGLRKRDLVKLYLDLQNPKISWSMWFVLLYCDDQLKSGRAHTIQTKSGRAWSHTALPVASG